MSLRCCVMCSCFTFGHFNEWSFIFHRTHQYIQAMTCCTASPSISNITLSALCCEENTTLCWRYRGKSHCVWWSDRPRGSIPHVVVTCTLSNANFVLFRRQVQHLLCSTMWLALFWHMASWTKKVSPCVLWQYPTCSCSLNPRAFSPFLWWKQFKSLSVPSSGISLSIFVC